MRTTQFSFRHLSLPVYSSPSRSLFMFYLLLLLITRCLRLMRNIASPLAHLLFKWAPNFCFPSHCSSYDCYEISIAQNEAPAACIYLYVIQLHVWVCECVRVCSWSSIHTFCDWLNIYDRGVDSWIHLQIGTIAFESCAYVYKLYFIEI